MGSHISFRNFTAIDNYRTLHCDKGLNRWDPKLKLGLLIAVIALNVVVAELELSAFLWATGFALVIYSRIPGKLFAIFFMAPAWATSMVVIGFSVGFGVTPLTRIGPVIFYHEGLISGISAAFRVASDMTWMAVVFLTTPFAEILKSLKSFLVPEIFCEAIGLIYRYVALLLEEFQKMSQAAQARGGMRSMRCRLRTHGQILSRVFLRAYDRSLNIQLAMQARSGF
jgi:cobalt ECF transporter T component CbiQ